MYKKPFNQERSGGFRGGSYSKDRSNKPPMMHKAICSNCGKSCEVPFKPTSGKPIYCKECFNEMGDGARDERPARREFNSAPRSFDRKPEYKSEYKPERRMETPKAISGNDDLKKQIELVNTKLDKLISLAEGILNTK